ncbi:hypothetical protein Droror1_Dr00018184 [Drosera rotundifolia]
MEIVEELSCEFLQEDELEHQENCNERWKHKWMDLLWTFLQKYMYYSHRHGGKSTAALL